MRRLSPVAKKATEKIEIETKTYPSNIIIDISIDGERYKKLSPSFTCDCGYEECEECESAGRDELDEIVKKLKLCKTKEEIDMLIEHESL